MEYDYDEDVSYDYDAAEADYDEDEDAEFDGAEFDAAGGKKKKFGKCGGQRKHHHLSDSFLYKPHAGLVYLGGNFAWGGCKRTFGCGCGCQKPRKPLCHKPKPAKKTCFKVCV